MAKRELLISQAAACNSARAQYRQGGNQPSDLKTPKAAQKPLKKGLKTAKLAFTATTLEGVGKGGVGSYWEAARALNSGGGPATKAAFEDGNVRETPGENAAAAAHFTKFSNIMRERPEGSRQRSIRCSSEKCESISTPSSFRRSWRRCWLKPRRTRPRRTS